MLFTISLSLRLKNVLLSSRAFWNLLLSFIVWNSTSYVKLSSIQPTHLRLLLPKRPQYRKTVHSTQESITCTILWVGEGYKEMERGHSISGSKRIQRLSQTPLNITSTLDSWLGLNFSPFFSQRNILGWLKHFQHPIFLMNSASWLKLEIAVVLSMISIKPEMDFLIFFLLDQNHTSKVFVLYIDAREGQKSVKRYQWHQCVSDIFIQMEDSLIWLAKITDLRLPGYQEIPGLYQQIQQQCFLLPFWQRPLSLFMGYGSLPNGQGELFLKRFIYLL